MFMNESELNYDDIMGEVDGILHRKLLAPTEQSEVSYHPSESQAQEAMRIFERNIQRPHVLVFFECNAYILNQFSGRERINLYKSRFSSHIKNNSAYLRIKGESGKADVLEETDIQATREVLQMQIEEESERLGRQVPGTSGYSDLDLRIKFLDRWGKFCDEVFELEKSEGSS